MTRFLSILLLLGFIFSDCNQFRKAVEDAKKETALPPRDNYIVLLDLSDRILFNNQQQVPKDIEVIQSLYSAFKSKLDQKDPTRLYYTVSDKLKILIAPQKNATRDIYEMAGNLRIELASAQPEKRAKLIEETEQKFYSLLPEIYKKAVISNNSTDYAGADIWRYFNEDLQGDLEPDAQNTLFVITDGYMNFETTEGRESQNCRYTSCAQIINNLKKMPDWSNRFQQDDYGLLSIDKKFPNLKVVLLELNPKDDWTGEYSLMTKIWSKWFTEMGIPSYTFIKDDNINEVNESLEKLMQVKLPRDNRVISWTAITDIDTLVAAHYLATLKKKDYSELNNSIESFNIPPNTAKKRELPVRQSIKQKDQLSFGPPY